MDDWQLESFLHVDNDMDAVLVDTPLHKAVRQGLREVAVEILKLMPSQGRKLNTEGYSPLQIALNSGNEDLVRAMIKLDPELIRVAGRGLVTPLHYVAGKNMADLLAMFLLYCPSAIEDLTARGETAVHVAVRKESNEAFKVLYGWLDWKGRGRVLSLQDWEGKNVLQLANETGQTEIKNILDPESYEKDKKPRLMEIGMKAGSSCSSRTSHSAFVDYLCSPDEDADFRRKFFRMVGKLDMDKRNAIMVVAVLIATATFQAILSPPGGFNDHNPINNSNATMSVNGNKNGPFLMSRGDYASFAAVNTIAFAFSLIVILLMIPFTLFNGFLYISITFLTITYVLAIKITTPDHNTFIAIAILLPTYILATCVVSGRFNAPDDEDETYWKLSVDKDYYARRNKAEVKDEVPVLVQP